MIVNVKKYYNKNWILHKLCCIIKKRGVHMLDWNHNGQIDPADSFIDYMIFQEVMGNKAGKKRSDSLDASDEDDEIDEYED